MTPGESDCWHDVALGNEEVTLLSVFDPQTCVTSTCMTTFVL